MALPFIIGSLIAADAASRSSARTERREESLQAQAQRGRAAGDLIGGIDVQEPGQVSRMIAMARGLASPDQASQKLAGEQLQAFSLEQGAGMTPEDTARLAAFEDEARRVAEMFPGQIRAQDLANESMRQQIDQQAEAFPYLQERRRQEIAMGLREIEAFDRTGGVGPVDVTKPQPVSNPYTQRVELAFLPGTTEQLKSQAEADATKGMLESVNEMRSLIDQYGRESWNDEVTGRARAIHTDLLQRLAADTGAGALGDQEREIWLRGVPDMTALDRPGTGDRMAAAYDQIYMRLARQYLQRGAANPYNIIDFRLFDDRIMSPEQGEFIKANQPKLR